MPRNTREWSKRKIEEAITNLTWVTYHLNDIAEVFQPVHPEISKQLEQFNEVIVNMIVILRTFSSTY